MAWIKHVDGAVNLDFVRQIVVQVNGDIYLYTDTSNYIVISGVASDQATGLKVARTITDAIDPTLYV